MYPSSEKALRLIKNFVREMKEKVTSFVLNIK